jgi:hypothetical protein
MARFVVDAFALASVTSFVWMFCQVANLVV